MYVTINVLLIFTIAVLCLFVLYTELLVSYKRGKSLLVVKLRHRHRLDGVIFVVLIAISFYRYHIYGEDKLTGFSLVILFTMSFYIYFIRQPKLVLKAAGFFYSNFFISYNRITNIRLSEDGVLVFMLGDKKIFIYVHHINDLERIYEKLIALNYQHSDRV